MGYEEKNEIIENDEIQKGNINNTIYPKGLENNYIYKKTKIGGYYSNYSYDIVSGNNCYINSSIQCLFHLKKFTDNITKLVNDKSGNLMKATSNLIEEMKIPNSKSSDEISVKEIKREMAKIDERYKDNNQEDANEFISNFLDGLLDETGDKSSFPEPLKMNNQQDQIAYNKFYDRFYKKRGNSFLLDLFYSIIKTQKVCKSCGKVISIKFNAYNIIELPIYNLAENNKDDLKFRDILADFMKKNENIIGECKYCKAKNNIYEIIKIYKLPKYLMFYFGRKINGQYIDNDIIYPIKLEMTQFLTDNEIKNTKYLITGVIHYSKFAKKEGHYTASCLYDDDIWYHFNDSIVTKEEEPNSYKNPIILIYKN